MAIGFRLYGFRVKGLLFLCLQRVTIKCFSSYYMSGFRAAGLRMLGFREVGLRVWGKRFRVEFRRGNLMCVALQSRNCPQAWEGNLWPEQTPFNPT